MRTAPELLRAWRKEADLSQGQAAEKLGVRQARWSELESGEHSPGRELAIRIEQLTGGAVPIEAWSDDPTIHDAMRSIVERRAAAHTANDFRKAVGE